MPDGGSVIGTAWVQARLDTSHVAADARESGKKAKEGFLESFKDIGSSLTSAIGIVGFAEIVKKTAEASDQLKEATDRAKVAAGNAGLAWGEVKKAMGEAQVEGGKLGFTNAQVADSYGTLITRFGSTETATRLLSGAEDLARFKKESLSTATDTLSKAQLGNAKALKDLGVIIPANATAEEKAAAVTAYLAKIHGQAEEATKSLGGQLNVLKTQFENQAATIGDKATPAISGFTHALESIGPVEDIAVASFIVFGSKISAIGKGVVSTYGSMRAAAQLYSESVASGAPRMASALNVASAGMVGLRSAGAGLVSMLGGPLGIALIGATVAFGYFSSQAAKQKDEVDSLKTSIMNLGTAYNQTHSLSDEAVTSAVAQNTSLRDLITNSDEYGLSVATITKAAAGDKKAQEEVTNALNNKQKALNNEIDTLSKHTSTNERDREANARSILSDRDKVKTIENLKTGTEEAFKATNDNTVATEKMSDAQDSATASTVALSDGMSALSAAMKMDDPGGVQQGLQYIVDTYDSYEKAVTGVKKAQEAEVTTEHSVADANRAAAQSVVSAKDSLTKASEGVASAQRTEKQAEDSLTQARKDAASQLQSYARQVAGIADTEEEARIRLEEAKQKEVSTRGLAATDIERRRAVVGLDEAQRDLANLLIDNSDLRAKAADANKKNIEGNAGVVSAKQAVVNAQDGIKTALKTESDARDAIRVAQQKQIDTQQAGIKQLGDAKQAIDDANASLDTQAYKLGLVEAHTGLTTAQIRDGLKPQLDAINKTFDFQVSDGGSTGVSLSQISQVEAAIKDLAGMYGVALVIPEAVAPHGQPKPMASGQRAPSVWGSGGLIPGFSPHSTADNIHALVTADEYIVNQASTRKHLPLLEAINADKYASGGLVLPIGQKTGEWIAPVLANIAALGGGGVGGTSAGGASVTAVQNWLRQVVDPMPYVFGAVGPTAFDCSGLVGDVWAALTGNPRNHRYFVTGNERQFLTGKGFKDGSGAFTVGFSGEHTMGNLGGLNFEAANSISGIHVGTGTSNVLSFPNVMHLPQLGSQFLSVGGGGGGGGGIPPDSAVTSGGAFGQMLRSLLAKARLEAALLGGVGDSGLADSASADVIRIAAQTGRAMGADRTAMMALFEAGLVESGFRNLSSGDRDSLGFLQQRAPWGSVASRENVADSTRRFLARAMAKEPWSGSAGALAQAVQVSEFPGRYDQRAGQASALLSSYGFDSGGILPPKSIGANFTDQPEAVSTVEQFNRPHELSDKTITKLAAAIVQASHTRPTELYLDGDKIAASTAPTLEGMFANVSGGRW